MVVLAMINKKTNKELVVSIGKIGIRFHLSHSLISMSILSSLIEIDARIKIIYIDSSHIKSLRMSPNYRSIA